MTICELVTSLSANPYFGAGFGLFGVGAVAALARRGAQVQVFVVGKCIRDLDSTLMKIVR